MSIPMEKRNSPKYNKPMRCYRINSQKFTTIKIIIAIILMPNLQKTRSKLTAHNPKPNRPVKATNITRIVHMPVKILMIISTVMLSIVKKRPSPSRMIKTSINMRKTKNKINKIKITRILIDKRSAPVLKLPGSNFKDRNNIQNNENINTKLHNKRE